MDKNNITKLDAEDFLVAPIEKREAVFGDSQQFEVDLKLQTCQCSEFKDHRQGFEVGDIRRFCKHMVQLRSAHPENLDPFVLALFESRDLENAGMPNGNAFSYFILNERKGFYGHFRNQSSFFFVKGLGPNSYHKFVYDLDKKEWLGDTPDQPDQLLRFAAKERGQYMAATEGSNSTLARTYQRRQRNRNATEPSSLVKWIMLAAAIAALIYGGFYLFGEGGPFQIAKQNENVEQEDDQPTKDELIKQQKAMSAREKKQQLEDKKNREEQNELNGDAEEEDIDVEDAASLLTPIESGEDTQTDDRHDEPENLEFRIWRTTDDSLEVSAKYRSFANGDVTLEKEEDGELIEVKEALLTEADRTYIAEVRRERRLRKAREAKREKEANKESE